MTVIGIIPVFRAGDRPPEAFIEVAGRPLLLHTVEHLRSAGVDRVLIAVDAVLAARARGAVGRTAQVLSGQPTRRRALLEAVSDRGPGVSVVLVHDAARAFAPATLIRSVIAAVRGGSPTVVPVLPVVDTIRPVVGGKLGPTVDRGLYRLVQTPQGFEPNLLRQALAAAPADAAGNEAALVAAIGGAVTAVPGDRGAFTFTTSADVAEAERLLQ